MDSAKKALGQSALPPFAKTVLSRLLESFGPGWHEELFSCDASEGSGPGTLSISLESILDSPEAERLRETMRKIEQLVSKHEEKNGSISLEPAEGYSEFLESLEYGDWEEDFDDEDGFILDMLHSWLDCRVSYYRSLHGLKLNEARERAYLEIESLDFNGNKEGCRSCGIIFFDNLKRHRGIEGLYCSQKCQEDSVLVCIECASEYTVGKVKNPTKRDRLNGWCSNDCKTEFRDQQNADSRYISAMRRKSELFGANFDKTITRREVFERAKGKCYICYSDTHLEWSEEYDPKLATVDHVIPWVKGGNHVWSNVQNCCLRCNIQKKDR